jgi:FMN phosphatase YigB (HAD superfamily)
MPDREEIERQNRDRDRALDLNKTIYPTQRHSQDRPVVARNLKAEVIALIDAKLEEYKEYGATMEALKDLKARISAL